MADPLFMVHHGLVANTDTPTCLNQTGPVSLMPLGKCKTQVKVGAMGGWKGGDSGGKIRKKRRGGRREEEERGMALLLTPLALVEICQHSSAISLCLALLCCLFFFLSFFLNWLLFFPPHVRNRSNHKG